MESGEWRAESEDFLLRAHTKGHRRLCRRARFQHPFHHQTAQRVEWSASGATEMARLRRVIFNKHQKGPGIDNSESFLVQ